MPDETVFIDTNGFLQLFDLSQLAWRDLFPNAADISVVVSSTVIDELDRHKASTNQRRRDRARKALRLIEQASEETGMALTIRESKPKVELLIYQGARPNWSNLAQLDESQPDDRLVAEALTHGEGAAVLTNDTGPRIRARMMGLTAYAPPESWLLPPEKTDDQLKIRSLERDLAEAQNARPRIELSIDCDSRTNLIEFSTIKLPPLSTETVDQLTELCFAQNPKAKLDAPARSSMDQLLMRQMGYRPEDIEQYDSAYAKFEDSVAGFFRDLHKKIAHQGCLKFVGYQIENVGNISARDLRCEIAIEGDFALLRSRKDAQDWVATLKPPRGPKKPALKELGFGSLHGMINERLFNDLRSPALSRPVGPSDSTKMVRYRGPDKKGEVFGCSDFRPDRIFQDEICLYGGGDGKARGEATIYVDAEHHSTISANVAIIENAVETKWEEVGELPFIPAELKGLLIATKVSRR